MPTKHRRHAVTETPPVREALEELRAEEGGEAVRMSELVILGAREKARQLRARRTEVAAGRARLAERIRAGALPGDPKAAAEGRERWARR